MNSFGTPIRALLLGLGLLVPLGLLPPAAAPVAAQGYEELEARIWIDGAVSPVFRRGDRASVFYRATSDAYVAVFHIDTDGIVRLLHPRVPGEDHYVRRDRTYRLRFARSSYWYVDDYAGVGYFFVVASHRPMDFSSFRYSHLAGGWDLESVGRRVYQDPYLAMDDFVAALVPDWRTGAYALDFVEYHVDRRYDYPRFLCYDCHTFRPYRSWNPYRYQCHSFRLIVHTDPYFYPVTRYRGTRVVYTRPPVRNVPRFAFKERARGEPATPIFQPASETDLPGVAGAERRRSTGQGGAIPEREAVPRSPSDAGRAPGVAAPEARRRGGAPSGVAPGSVRDGAPGNRAEPDSRSAPRAGPRGAPPSDGNAEPRAAPRRPSDALGGARREAPDRARTERPGADRPSVSAPPRAPSDRDRGRDGDARTRAPAPDPDPPRPFLERRTSPRGDSDREPAREPTTRPRDGRPSDPAPRSPAPSTRRPPTSSGSGSSTGPRGSSSRPSASPAPRSGSSRPSASPGSGGGRSRPSASPSPRSGGSRPSASPRPQGGSSRPSASPGSGGRGSRPSASPAPRGGSRSGGSPEPRRRPRPR